MLLKRCYPQVSFKRHLPFSWRSWWSTPKQQMRWRCLEQTWLSLFLSIPPTQLWSDTCFALAQHEEKGRPVCFLGAKYSFQLICFLMSMCLPSALWLRGDNRSDSLPGSATARLAFTPFVCVCPFKKQKFVGVHLFTHLIAHNYAEMDLKSLIN